jgi:Flp pilus assembly protein TadD
MHSIDKVKDAKGIHLRGTKTDNKSPVNSWLKGRIAAREKQFSIAESQWKSVLEHQPFEIQAHRELAVLHYARIAKSANESRKCLKEAQTAFDLEPTHNWYSHFVLALALHGANDSSKAREHIEEALRLATEENQVLCQNLSAAIQNNESYEWDFKRKLGAIEN